MNSFLGIDAGQWFILIGVIISLIMGILNWYDKRVPSKNLSPIESGQLNLTQNKAVEMANKRALDAEIRADKAEERVLRLENMYEVLKLEFEDWIQKQNYKITFNVTLGSNPKIMSTQIYHDRRVLDVPYEGVDKRK